MKKKVSYLLGTIISLIATAFSSATAFACGGGDMGYMPPDDNTQISTFQIGKSNVIVTSYLAERSLGYAKVFVDGMETQAALPKGNTSEKQRILKAVKEISCSIANNPNQIPTEEGVKNIFKKYGFKTDDASMNALEAKYENDVNFMKQVETAAKSCLGNSYKDNKSY